MEEQKNVPAKAVSVQAILGKEDVKKRFADIMGKRADSFMSSIISATKSNSELLKCDPNSVISSAVIAATLNLPIEQNLGFAAIVPYGGKAQFQIMWKGFVQLAIRTNQYKNINTAIIYEGELQEYNRITGDVAIDQSKKISDKIVGYVAYFRLISGFEKYYYMTHEEAQKHGKKYSKSYSKESSKWQQDFDAMALKTVIKMLLSKYGILSVEMQTAIQADQAVVKDNGSTEDVEFEYMDNPETRDSAETVAENSIAKIEESLTNAPEPKEKENPLAPFIALWGEPESRTELQKELVIKLFADVTEAKFLDACSKCGVKSYLELADFAVEVSVEKIIDIKKLLKLK